MDRIRDSEAEIYLIDIDEGIGDKLKEIVPADRFAFRNEAWTVDIIRSIIS